MNRLCCVVLVLLGFQQANPHVDGSDRHLSVQSARGTKSVALERADQYLEKF
jgi:hypothetical protein